MAFRKRLGPGAIDQEGETAKNSGDAQVVVVGNDQPVIGVAIEAQHPLGGAFEIPPRRGAPAQSRDVVRSDDGRECVECACLGERKQPLNVVVDRLELRVREGEDIVDAPTTMIGCGAFEEALNAHGCTVSCSGR